MVIPERNRILSIPPPRMQAVKQRRKPINRISVYLVIDIEHSILDLLIDFFGCIDESLETTKTRLKRKTQIYWAT